ncbi:biotin--[acetyl-CoA-carboxylase] ligase [Amylibacter sp. IMCC11727]|uniref:biotin--[acetyl-CoA-carboxylase] ligase n=1 Tax=Amylibacter sp. IMCC11727 TaxID=3039851 RepID=UPI00244DDEB3|nr:biotin--[acetyl-CoA-carboxylase] ligase [Amylibacter sp. IMCC11727]WGI23408.1 biotin--[acetyl-CoA-carboxylase] ligase [Amylibacter sp. IMCC11727]
MQDWPLGTQRFVFDTIDSTMAEARRQAPAIAGAAWFLAHEQTAGTGRRGRAWDSQKGNFAASLLIRPNTTPDQLALRSFVAALALYDTLVALTGREEVFTLKWPNDVLLRGGKLAGILLETLNDGQGHPALIIGIGVNLANMPSPSKLEERAIGPQSLAQSLGVKVSPETVLDTLAVRFDHWEHQLATYGFGPIRTAWLAHAANIGKTITARMGDRSITGTFKTVDETGALRLQAPDGLHVITAADISF